MVIAALRVEVTQKRSGNNPLYGSTSVKKVVEETYEHDFDKREDIAPFGIIAKLTIGEIELNIKVNRYYFDYTGYLYTAFFNINDNVYELNVSFDGNKIESIYLEEWFESGYFQDGDDADNVYYMAQFDSVETFLD